LKIELLNETQNAQCMLNLNCYYETIIATIYRMYHFYVILVLVQMLHARILLQFDHTFYIQYCIIDQLMLLDIWQHGYINKYL